MSILITGSEGFLGDRLTYLLHEKKMKVIGLDVLPPKSEHPWPAITGDITNPHLIESVFKEHDIRSIIHAGGISGPHVCNNDPLKVFEINVNGTLHLLEAARRYKMPGRFIIISSSSVYGEPSEKISIKHPLEEEAPLFANEPYGCSKVACESLARAYGIRENLDIVSLRMGIVYGPGRDTYCEIYQMLKSALDGQPIILRKGSSLPLPWIHIEDLENSILAVLQAPREAIEQLETLAYNVTGPDFPSLKEIAHLIKKLIPKSTIKETDEPDLYSMNARKMSIMAMRDDFGWEPITTIEEGVQSIYEVIKQKPKTS
jgi:nucleoside-diphosphate-sugar epimerase